MANKATAPRKRAPASMPAGPPPPAPPPVEAQQPPEPEPRADPVTERLVELGVLPGPEDGPPAPPQDASEPPAPAPQVQQPPASPAPQASPGSALAPVLGNSLGKNHGGNVPSLLGTENPGEFPREFPRAYEVPAGNPGFQPRTGRTRRDNIQGRKRHPRQEAGQLNPGVRRYLAEAAVDYADQEGIGKGAALDHLLELALRLEAPHLVAHSFAQRAAALGALNDWADASEAILELAMRHTDEATVLRVLARLKNEAAHQ